MKKRLFLSLFAIIFIVTASILFFHSKSTVTTVCLPNSEAAVSVGSTILQTLYPPEEFPNFYETDFTWECLENQANNTWTVFQYREGMLGGGLEICLNKTTAEVLSLGPTA